MSSEPVTREELVSRMQRINRLMTKLSGHPQSFASEMYPLPDNPTPKHLTRMLDDLRALAEEHGDKETDPEVVWDLFYRVEEHLESLRQLLYRASAPSDPFTDHC